MLDERHEEAFNRSKNNLFLRSAQFGVELEREPEPMERTMTSSGITFFISVPKKSELKLDDGTEASGEALAKWFKQMVIDSHDEVVYGVDNLRHFHGFIDFKVSVKYKVRDEIWTEEKEEQSTLHMMAKLITINKLKQESGEKTQWDIY